MYKGQAFALTWLVPAGSYDTAINEGGREVVVPGTFQVLDAAPEVPVWSLVTVIPRALESAQGIIFFVLIIGGALGVLGLVARGGRCGSALRTRARPQPTKASRTGGARACAICATATPSSRGCTF